MFLDYVVIWFIAGFGFAVAVLLHASRRKKNRTPDLERALYSGMFMREHKHKLKRRKNG